MKQLFTIALLMICSAAAYSQNVLTSSIRWETNSTFDATSGTMTDEVSKIVTSSSQIIWYNANYVARQTFTIVGSEGTWTNVSNEGSVILKVTSGAFSGIAQFSKADGVQRIRIHIVNGENSKIYDFTVTSINIL